MAILDKIRDFMEEAFAGSFLIFYLLCKHRFKYWRQKDIKNYQERRMRAVARRAFAKSPFFKNHYSGFDLSDIWNLPPVNKKIMMENLTGYNTVGLSKEEIIDFCLEVEGARDFSKRLEGINVGMSSGTSGNKGVEIVTPREEGYMKAALLSRFDFPKGEKINLAFILRVSAPAFNLDKFGHKLTYISQLNPIEKIIDELEKLDPNILSAPPSMLKIIAKEVEAGRLAIKPKRVISYAEVLYPDVKIYLEKVFGGVIHQIYKCTEGPVAITCRYGSLHINEDLVAVETLNGDGTATAAGEPCKRLLITDLHKHSQPIIRYELNDIIVIDKNKCRCGSNFRVIKEVQGRADDMFWGLRNGSLAEQFVFQDYISRAIISTSGDIDDFQAIQTDYDKIVLRIKLAPGAAGEGLREKLSCSIKKIFSDYDCALPDIEIIFADPVPNELSNKLSRIICKISK
ncbi:MAG: F390 synthetase-related protein [Minisyncoccales bacterium]